MRRWSSLTAKCFSPVMLASSRPTSTRSKRPTWERNDERRDANLLDENRQAVPSPYRAGVSAFGVVVVDLPAREAFQHLFQRDTAFKSGQRGAHAEVQSVAEGDVVVDFAADVEAVRIRE